MTQNNYKIYYITWKLILFIYWTIGQSDQFNHVFIISLGGAGGKGTWGKPGDELSENTLDEKDPNYDSEEADVSTY